MDTINTTINYERVYLCNKETFIEMKDNQKAFATNLKSSKKSLKEYLKTNPSDTRPVYDLLLLKQRARIHNIIYSIVRGRTYSQIEPKVKKDNEPSKWALLDMIKKYEMDPSLFHELKELL